METIISEHTPHRQVAEQKYLEREKWRGKQYAAYQSNGGETVLGLLLKNCGKVEVDQCSRGLKLVGVFGVKNTIHLSWAFLVNDEYVDLPLDQIFLKQRDWVSLYRL